jgi:hypothetical protein
MRRALSLAFDQSASSSRWQDWQIMIAPYMKREFDTLDDWNQAVAKLQTHLLGRWDSVDAYLKGRGYSCSGRESLSGYDAERLVPGQPRGGNLLGTNDRRTTHSGTTRASKYRSAIPGQWRCGRSLDTFVAIARLC